MGKSTRVLEIDGLRGLAIVAVIFRHYVGASVPTTPGSGPAYCMALTRLGLTGVDLFFVLSGFLIGGILLDARGSPSYFRTFYVRRFCRILPLYLVVLVLFELSLCLPAFAGSDMLQNPPPLWACLTFTQNFWLSWWAAPGETRNALTVTWSLAIEEHFYCTLPLFVWLLPRRPLVWVLTSGVVLAPVLRHFVSETPAYHITPCRMDSLCLGVLAALFVRSPRGSAWLATHRLLMHAALGLTTSGMTLVTYGKPAWLFHNNHTLIALFYLCLVFVAVSYTDGWAARVARTGCLRWAGTLCYGLYLLHMPALYLGHLLIGRGSIGYPIVCDLPSLVATLGALLATCVMASLSWRYFEDPFVRLGHRWTYGGGPMSRKKLSSGAQHTSCAHGPSLHPQLS
jgi:peptidoglycan/LPS O-acetylase OafA/YrhL